MKSSAMPFTAPTKTMPTNQPLSKPSMKSVTKAPTKRAATLFSFPITFVPTHHLKKTRRPLLRSNLSPTRTSSSPSMRQPTVVSTSSHTQHPTLAKSRKPSLTQMHSPALA